MSWGLWKVKKVFVYLWVRTYTGLGYSMYGVSWFLAKGVSCLNRFLPGRADLFFVVLLSIGVFRLLRVGGFCVE